MDQEEYVPKFSPKTRTIVYVTGVGIAFLSFVGAGIALAVDQPVLAGILGMVGTGWSGVANAFGVGYNPLRNN